MAFLLQKLLRKPSSSTRIISHLSKPHFPSFPPTLPLPPLQSHLGEAPKTHQCPTNAVQNLGSQAQLPKVYPSFSFEFFLNPDCSSGLLRSEPEDARIESDGSPAVWADSVKKKRKRKMNKHKYRKLRKRLRQKS